MKTLNGYEVVDEKARQDIETLKNKEVDLTGYATEDWVNNQGFIKEHQSLEGYATEQYVNDAIANIDIPEGDGVKAVFIDASNVTASSSAIPEEYLPIFQKYDSGEDRNCLFYVKLSSATYYQPTSIYCPEEQILSLDFGMTKNNADEIYYKSLIVRLGTSDWYINTHSTTFASKYYVDNLFANIATAEGGSY